MTRIGLVIPTFNRCGSLSRCLESLATEVAKGDLLAVVDAGSTDGTVEMVRRDCPDAMLIQATTDA